MNDFAPVFRENHNLFAYIHKANLTVVPITTPAGTCKDPSFFPFEAIERAFQRGCESVLWIEADILLTDLAKSLSDAMPDADLQVPLDATGTAIDTGIVMARRTASLWAFLKQKLASCEGNTPTSSSTAFSVLTQNEEWGALASAKSCVAPRGSRYIALHATPEDMQDRWRPRDFAVRLAPRGECPMGGYEGFMAAIVERSVPDDPPQPEQPETPVDPFMTQRERNMLLKVMARAKHYIEFGMGGSSYQVVQRANVEKVVSVEADNTWVKTLRVNPSFQEAMRSGRLDIYYVDVNGDPENFSNPRDMSMLFNWVSYANVIARYPVDYFDTVFIDGRFRVMCALYVYDFITTSTRVVIHDFKGREHIYGAVKEFYDVVQAVETMVLLRKKEDVDRQRLEIVRMKYSLEQG